MIYSFHVILLRMHVRPFDPNGALEKTGLRNVLAPAPICHRKGAGHAGKTRTVHAHQVHFVRFARGESVGVAGTVSQQSNNWSLLIIARWGMPLQFYFIDVSRPLHCYQSSLRLTETIQMYGHFGFLRTKNAQL